MAHKKLSKAFQIAGLRKALKNRKTPRQFLPSMRRRLAKLTAVVAILFVMGGCAAQVKAQGQVFTIPQTVTQVLAPAGTACTGSPQIFSIQNLGQTQHYAYIATVNTGTLLMQIFGIDAAGNPYLISDAGTIGAQVNGTNPVLTATGYFPNIRISVTCTSSAGAPGTANFTLNYTGTSSTTNINVGGYQLAQLNKVIIEGSTPQSPVNVTFTAPFSNSFGTLTLSFGNGVAGPTGANIAVQCRGAASNLGTTYTFFPATTTGIFQTFVVPDSFCSVVNVNYTPVGISAASVLLEYVFSQPGFTLNSSYLHITGTTATVVKPGPGVLKSLVVGTAAAGTITIFDLAPAACTGTPVTNIVSVITSSSAIALGAETFGELFNNGICIKSSATIDLTAVYQ